MSKGLIRLYHSSRFWLAVLAVAQTVLFAFNPQFPPEVWKAIDSLIVVLITAITVEDSVAKVNQ